MAGKRGMAHQDLRHFKGGITAGEDLRAGQGDSTGIRPGILRMLFRGGSVERSLAHDDLRHGRRESVRPRTDQMLFKGGRARGLATEDLRMDHDGEDSVLPGNTRMLADGGEVDDVEVGEDLIIAAEDIMDSLQGGYFGSSPSESDSKVERASKEASKRARAKILAQALKAFFMLCDSEEPGQTDDGE